MTDHNFVSRAGFEVPLDKPPAPKPTLGSKRGGAKKKGRGAKKKVSVEADVDWVIHVILDARTRREHPSASTHLELSVPVERAAFRDCKWVLQEVNQKLNVPALGLRRLRDSHYLDESDALSACIENGETLVAYSAEPTEEELKRSESLGRAMIRSKSGTTTPDRASSRRSRTPDRLRLMADHGAQKNLAARRQEKNTASIQAAMEAEEAARHDYSPRTNIVTKRRVEEKKKMEKAKIAQKRKSTLLHLLDGGWKGEMPLPGSYDKPASVSAIFHICGDQGDGAFTPIPHHAADDGGATYGWMELLFDGDLGGPEGIIVRWTARTPSSDTMRRTTSMGSSFSSSSGSFSSSRGRGRDKRNSRGATIVPPAGAGTSRHGRSKSPPPLWNFDLEFPPSISGGSASVPALLCFSSSLTLELALPVSENIFPAPRPEIVAWPHAIMTLNLVDADDINPKPRKNLKLGTSLKNVVMSILKEVKKLAIAVLRSPTGAPIANRRSTPKKSSKVKGFKKVSSTDVHAPTVQGREHPHPVKGVIRLWTIRIEFQLDVDPFWSILKLKTGLARLYDRFPALLPGNELASMSYLAQAMEDEKDGRLRDRVDDFKEELTSDLSDVKLQVSEQGEHSQRQNDDSEVTWSAGHCLSADPLSVYLLTNTVATGPSLCTLRMAWLQDARPLGTTTSSIGGVTPFHDELALRDVPDPDLGRPDEKGQRGKLIMAAERNKKALEDGTYGVGSGHYAVEKLGGDGPLQPCKEETIAIRLEFFAKEISGDGSIEGATAVYDRRRQRLNATGEAILSKIRAGRLEAAKKNSDRYANDMENAATSKKAEDNKAMLRGKKNRLGSLNKTSKGNSFSNITKGKKNISDNASWATQLIDIRYKRLQNANEAKLDASRKRARPEEARVEAEKGAALLNKQGKDPAAQARERDRILAARKRKIIDFYNMKGSKVEKMSDDAIKAKTLEEQPIGEQGKTKKDMTQEEKEMLEVLKGIGKPSAAAEAGVAPDAPANGGGSPPKRPKIKNARLTSEIASARMEFLFGKSRK